MLTNQFHSRLRNTTIAVLIGIVCGCQSINVDDAPASVSAPAGAELENLTYVGIARGPVTLTNGEWQGDPFSLDGSSRPNVGLISDFNLTGDLNGDGMKETVVFLWSNSGGSGTFDYIAVVGRDPTGAPLNLATAILGDRVKIRGASINDGRIVIDVVQAGPRDAACCPGQKFRRTFILADHALIESPSEKQGRQSIADLADIQWVLIYLDKNKPLPDGIEVTLHFAGKQISGTSACNRYSGSVIEGSTPGALTVSRPLLSTRMACPPPRDAIEQRYQERLQVVHQYTFAAGKLALTWNKNDQSGTMLFASKLAID